MTEEEKKEFEEFLQWKREKAAKEQATTSKDKTKSFPEEHTSSNKEEETSDYNKKEINQLTPFSSCDNRPSNNDNKRIIYTLFASVFALILFAIIAGIISNNTKNDALNGVLPAIAADIDTIAVAPNAASQATPQVSTHNTSTSPDPQKITWNNTTKKDEMTDAKNIWASITSDNYITQDFPYDGATYASITVRYMKKHGYSVLISISKGQIDGREYYSTDYITARFDGGSAKKYRFNEAADGSSDVVFIRNKSDFIKRCKQAKDIKIDIPIYQAGRPVFSFHVDEPLVWPE